MSESEEIHDFLKPAVNRAQRLIAQQVEPLKSEIQRFQSDFEVAKQELDKKQADLTSKLEGFYGKLIEIFGLFIAVFSFIIAGIQVASKATGDFWQVLGYSCGIFIPITGCIAVLLLLIRWTTRR
ncbi:hypothetical protein [Hymenobacter glacieicola]|uniref:Uncharacterized protein n=1 Tax=Hymenobacter glacieicola TaxID=1562124 RepID=A0ABQ1WNL1_9BACT|nr:hypothetical protein [Hymenobacter glacieicola]GGG34032.1 hypothetical protein GCM10011378_08080 [Hymenobacter glacieicola]